MFSVHTIITVIYLCAMLHLSDGHRSILLPLTDSDKKEIINIHNNMRRSVNPPAANMKKMVWSEEAETNAENYAVQCTGQHSTVSWRFILHPELFSCGENLYLSTSKDSWKEIIGEWKKEYEYFIYGEGQLGNIVGHITQVIWADSYLIGCAAAHCKNLGMFLVVCHYCPAGNDLFTLYKPYESGPWCSKCTGACEDKLCVI